MTKDDVNEVPANVALDFITEILPFNELDRASLLKLSRKCTIDFFPKGTSSRWINPYETRWQTGFLFG